MAQLYLRLKAAGIFYKVLNTPARIDIIEAMGHLERADAEFLRDAATFYRAVDHALHAALLLDPDRDYEAFAPDGDQLILPRATLGQPPQIAAQ